VLKAILFDLDDTLMPDESAADASLVAVSLLADAWYDTPSGDFKDTARRIAREVWRGHPLVAGGFDDISSWEALSSTFEGDGGAMAVIHNWVPEFRYEVWSRVLAEGGIADPLLTEQLAAAYPLERKSRYAPFPDVLPVLEELKREYRLGCVTNGPCDLQCEKLARSGLEKFFAVRIISRVVGVAKPDPRIFGIALERLGIAPEEAIYIGDTPKHDVVGAHAAGMKAVWLNRDKRPAVDGIVPDAEIATLPELRAVLAHLG
jgi:putative hydrolase of the HAD superfamily